MTLVRAAGFTYFPLALLARLPYAMMVVGVLTLVVSARGELALGGLTSAMVGVGTALVGPLIGAAADRAGQRKVVLAAGIANSLALLAMALIAFRHTPDVYVLLVALAIGATAPQVSPMSRSRLVGIIANRLPGDRHAAVMRGTMAYESAADEVVFVFGPFIVGLLATTLNPAAPVIGAAVLTVVFVTGFALHSSGSGAVAAAGSGRMRQAPARELARPGLIAVTVGVFGMGLFFGSMLTALTAFVSDLGHPQQAGLVYGAMGVGSAALALGVAWFPVRFSLRARWLAFASILAAATLTLPLVSSVPEIVCVLLVAGTGVGPTLVTQYSFGAERSPLGRSATVMTILGSAVVVGQSAASALVGALGQSLGTTAAMLAPPAAALVVLGAGAANWFVTGRPARAAADTGSGRGGSTAAPCEDRGHDR
jgi:MFS family permease